MSNLDRFGADIRLLIIGNPEQGHVGHHFLSAAVELGIESSILDSTTAYGNGVYQRILWRFDRLPVRMRAFESQVLQRVREWHPQLVLVTGLAPVSASALDKISTRWPNTKLVNFLTDDPWNAAHQSTWFLGSLVAYDHVYTPRTENLSDLKRILGSVSYLPFALNPSVHFANAQAQSAVRPDIVFVGGADKDRHPFIQKLLSAGLSVELFGGYWDRFGFSKDVVRGIQDASQIRAATSNAKLNLILVRRANRDQHVMRSYEAAAMGGSLLVEDTPEHRNIFPDTLVNYFTGISDIDRIARIVLQDPAHLEWQGRQLAKEFSRDSQHTYVARLQRILADQLGQS